ncbi:hypothetical protein L9F63_019024 [Diploptera punctata]|uniref:DUF4817 domain-containing protein n=1 Tax=Diploptera punctata TaxID=6984 RepID=A0AAD7ZVH5_DIPPU|nr:hypothetical protein L9F63_019024 [Diploptera punctata]
MLDNNDIKQNGDSSAKSIITVQRNYRREYGGNAPDGKTIKQDGALPYWSLDVRNSLKESFPDRWIGRGGPIGWPPRSPDITPLEFFLWVYVKDRVFATPVQDLHDLRTCILDTIATAPINILDRTWQEFFLWVYVKDRVFATPVQDLHDLRTCILDTIATAPINILDRTWQEIEYRLYIVRTTNGAHIEVF